MDNYLLIKKTEQAMQLSKELGFNNTYFVNQDFVIIKAKTTGQLVKDLRLAGRKKTLFLADSEELLRYALEKTNVNMVMNMENINPKDSVHFVRGALDQITCKIAADKNKTICFSVSNIINSENKGKLLSRMKFNLKLCKKYKVQTVFSNFSESLFEMRSSNDLSSLKRVIEKK